jgi:hypothetical protein
LRNIGRIGDRHGLRSGASADGPSVMLGVAPCPKERNSERIAIGIRWIHQFLRCRLSDHDAGLDVLMIMWFNMPMLVTDEPPIDIRHISRHGS